MAIPYSSIQANKTLLHFTKYITHLTSLVRNEKFFGRGRVGNCCHVLLICPLNKNKGVSDPTSSVAMQFDLPFRSIARKTWYLVRKVLEEKQYAGTQPYCIISFSRNAIPDISKLHQLPRPHILILKFLYLDPSLSLCETF